VLGRKSVVLWIVFQVFQSREIMLCVWNDVANECILLVTLILYSIKVLQVLNWVNIFHNHLHHLDSSSSLLSALLLSLFIVCFVLSWLIINQYISIMAYRFLLLYAFNPYDFTWTLFIWIDASMYSCTHVSVTIVCGFLP